MNAIASACAVLLLPAYILHAQEPPESSPVQSGSVAAISEPNAETAQAPVASTARILGDIPDGTQAQTAPPTPKLTIRNEDVLQTTTHEQGGRTITIQKIKPIALPPPPVPTVPQASAEADNTFRETLAEFRADHLKSGLLFLGATVYRSADSPPRSLVSFWPQSKSETITFWSSADFALIAGGVISFIDTAEETHGIMMGWNTVEIDRMEELMTTKGQENEPPKMPKFPEGTATFQVVGGQPTAEDLIPIQSLHDIYNKELVRLKTAYQGRERARFERAAYLKAHPPQPKHITLNYWRIDTPTPAKGGDK